MVGYTNAGKSSLMRALTGSGVLVADKLFATLDTTVRALQPETKPRVLVSDTVGFIKKLPHDLVASVRSTLAEALRSLAVLLFVVDASDPTYEVTARKSAAPVLREIGAEGVPSYLLLTKIDRVGEADRAALREKCPGRDLCSPRNRPMTWPLCVRRSSRSSRRRWWMISWCCRMRSRGCSATSTRILRVLSEDYDTVGRIIKLRGLPSAIARSAGRTMAAS